MKILLVAAKETTRDTLLQKLQPRGLDLIHYTNPIKAMDNIDEIEPNLVLFSAEDFPRHWKPYLHLLHESVPKEKVSFILLRGDMFPFEEAAKAKHLQVNGIILEKLDDRKEWSHLEELFARYSEMKDGRSDQRYIPRSYDKLEFLFSHPNTYSLVSGELDDISASGAAFIPDSPELTGDIEMGTPIPQCSLKMEEEIFSFSCTVVRNEQTLGLSFEDVDETIREKITDFIDRYAERELKIVTQNHNEDSASLDIT